MQSDSVRATAARGRIHCAGRDGAAWDGAAARTTSAAVTAAGATAGKAAAAGQDGGKYQTESEDDETFHVGILSRWVAGRPDNADRCRPLSGQEGSMEIPDLGIRGKSNCQFHSSIVTFISRMPRSGGPLNFMEPSISG
jgi:hypothetical protein